MGFTKELHRRFHDSGVTAYAIHPGAVSTELSNHLEEWFPSWWNNTFGVFFKTFFLKTSWNGAQTSIHCAISEDMEELSGHYFADCKSVDPSKAAMDEVLQRTFWKSSEKIVNSHDEAKEETSTSDTIEETKVSPSTCQPEDEKETSTSSHNSDNEQLSEPCTSEQVEPTPEIMLEESKNEVEQEVKEKRLDSDTEEQINEERVKRELLKEPEVELKEVDHEVSIVNKTYETNETKVISDEEEDKPAEESNLMETIEQFDKASLNIVETQEKSQVPDAEIIEQEKLIIEAETQENKALFEKVTEELVKEESNLQATETKESSNLPDKYDILKEKVEDVMAQEVESFDHETLKPVKTFEVDPIESMKVQQSLNNDIEKFDAEDLKPTECVEKLVLPTAEVIEQEKEVIENETQANKEVFQNTVLKTLESFDATELKHVETQETSVEESFKEGYVQEKTH